VAAVFLAQGRLYEVLALFSVAREEFLTH